MLALASLADPVPVRRLFTNQPEQRRALTLEALAAAGVPVLRVATTDSSALDEACRLGVLAPELLELLRTAHADWAADDQADEFFRSQETEPGDAQSGLVPYFFVRSRPAPTDDLYRRLSWHATDFASPLFAHTASALEADAAVMRHAATLACEQPSRRCLYALTTQPGHHASRERYGGYCFVNWAVLLVKLLEQAGRTPFVLDVDYHAGDGTAAMLGAEGMVSLHCADDYPYISAAEPWAVALPPQTDWAGYEPHLREALDTRLPEGCDVLVVSLGADTLAGDPDRCVSFCFKFKLSTLRMSFAPLNTAVYCLPPVELRD